MHRFALSLLLLAACHHDTGGTTTTAPRPAAATNTSIASAIRLTAGQPQTVVIPCGAGAYFGPFDFTTVPTDLAIVDDHHSLAPDQQVCAQYTFVDTDDVVVDGAALGCDEGHDPPTRGRLAYQYSPPGSSPATSIYLKVFTDDAQCNRSSVTLTLQ